MTTYKVDWGRVLGLWAVLVALMLTMFSCQMVEAAEWEDLGVVHKTLIAEAGGEGIEGMHAVANVIRNRAVKRGLTVEEVCLQRLQFSAWNKGAEPVDRMVRCEKGVWDDALMAWQASATEDITGMADHYFASYILKPSWAKKMRHTVTIGRHQFYRAY